MEPIAILKDLIALPSVNPMGRTVAGPEFFEGRMTDYLVDYFARLACRISGSRLCPGARTSWRGSTDREARQRSCSTPIRTRFPSME